MEDTIKSMQEQIESLTQQLRNQRVCNSAAAAVDEAVRFTQIPDTRKYLPEFAGNTNTITTWIDTVERTLAICNGSEDSVVYQMWLGHVRNRIVHKANKVLLNKNCPLNWTLIKESLLEHFLERRDLGSLTYDISKLKQNNLSLSDF